MDHRSICDKEYSPFLLTTLNEVDKMLSQFDKGTPPDLTKEDSYSDDEQIPKDVIESSLKLLRTIRKMAVKEAEHTTDIHVGQTIFILKTFILQIGHKHTYVPSSTNLEDQHDANSTTKPTDATAESESCPSSE